MGQSSILLVLGKSRYVCLCVCVCDLAATIVNHVLIEMVWIRQTYHKSEQSCEVKIMI